MTDDRDLDLVLLGATGFTGGLTAEDLARELPAGVRWAVAGRDRTKLEQVAARLDDQGPPASRPDLVEVDVTDLVALLDLTARTRVLATTVGPYERLGEPVVQACVRSGTDYVDITGEPAFVTAIIDRYHRDAERRGVRIVPCCGFDSVPPDLGAQLAVEQLPDDVPIRLRGYVSAKGRFAGGTLNTALEAVGRRTGLSGSRPDPGPGRHVGSLPRRIGRVDAIDGWALPLPTIDPMIVQRSAALLPAYGPDFRYAHHLRVGSLPTAATVVGTVGTAAGIAQFAPGRALLRRLMPAPGAGPDAATRERSRFRVTMLGEGGGQHVRAEVRGGDPGGTETARMLAEAATALVLDRDALPDRTGVLTPASAFGPLLRERLRRRGMVLEVVEPS